MSSIDLASHELRTFFRKVKTIFFLVLVITTLSLLGVQPSFAGLFDGAGYLLSATARAVSNLKTLPSFFLGNRIYSQIPHLPAQHPLGHLGVTADLADALVEVAKSSSNGVASFWAGPYPGLYLTDSVAWQSLVLESRVGVIDEAAKDHLNWLSSENLVMGSFPAFQSIHSKTYEKQRQFLMRRFHGGAKNRLAEIEQSAKVFLKAYTQTHKDSPRPLRECVTAMVLNTSSQLLGLSQYALDRIYFENDEFRRCIEKVAHYGISESGNNSFQDSLERLFSEMLEKNFEQVKHETPDTNLIRNIFESFEEEFPKTFSDFSALQKDDHYKKVYRKIAMTFASIGLGAMVHSSANSLDWALASLLQNPEEWAKLTAAARQEGLDLHDPEVFDDRLSSLTQWVLVNVGLNPPFSHQFFFVQKEFRAQLRDGSVITVPKESLIVPNYTEINQSDSVPLSSLIEDHDAIGKFVSNPRVASFGGSRLTRENNSLCANTQSRLCPGAKTSLYEQVIMIAILLRDYSLEVKDELSTEVDRNEFPLRARINQGSIILRALQ